MREHGVDAIPAPYCIHDGIHSLTAERIVSKFAFSARPQLNRVIVVRARRRRDSEPARQTVAAARSVKQRGIAEEQGYYDVSDGVTNASKHA